MKLLIILKSPWDRRVVELGLLGIMRWKKKSESKIDETKVMNRLTLLAIT